MPRRASRASAGSKRESSPALIIALVFMVLLGLVLGVLLYLEKDKTAQAQTKEKQADEKYKALDVEVRDYLRGYYMAKLRSYLDPNSVTAEEYEKIKEMESKYQGRTVPLTEWFAALKDKMEGNPNNPANRFGLLGPVDPNTGKPRDNVPNKITTLTTQLTNEIGLKDKTRKELQATQDDYKKYRDEWNATVQATAVKKAQDESQKQAEQALALKDATIQELKQKIADVSKEVDLMLNKANEGVAAERKRLRENYEKQVSELTADFKRQRDLLEQSKIIHLDQPRGLISRVERGEMVHINVGSDERVMPGLTFSVYAKGPGGKPESDPKGKIEVVSVLGPKQSLARITQMYLSDAIRSQYVDPTRVDPWVKDPREFYRARTSVLAGDLIYNPAWDPTRRVRVALAGVFDLDGDGDNDIDTFRRMLRDMNAEVVAYIDDKAGEPKLVGALDYKTDFLILGGMPETAGEKVVDTRRQLAGGQMILLAGQLQDEATKKGVEIMPLSRFLTRMGYSSIRVATSPRGNGNGNGKPAPAPAVKPDN